MKGRNLAVQKRFRKFATHSKRVANVNEEKPTPSPSLKGGRTRGQAEPLRGQAEKRANQPDSGL